MKAVGLFSGGLDSQLAAYIMKKQNIEVHAVNFETPFFGACNKTFEAAKHLDVQLHVLEISDDYMEVLKNPVYGYGKNMNPCIDCHAFMIKKAGEFMKSIDASFIFTGEVLGQRPMSQNKSSLQLVEKLSGYESYVLRPLSAKLMPTTIPEEKGWVNRDLLLDISGRSRTRQMELAKEYGILDYPSPAGGCLLTDAAYSRKLRHLLEMHPEHPPQGFGILKLGRHFNLDTKHLLIVGRNHNENESLRKLSEPKDYLLRVVDVTGPIGLIRSLDDISDENLHYAAKIVARYSDAAYDSKVKVKVFNKNDKSLAELEVMPLMPEQVPKTI